MAHGGLTGIHHVTAIAGDPQENLNFYTGILGLQFVKKTVNFDDPYTYHFYFGDQNGRPGSLITFFPWTRAGRPVTAGPGSLSEIAFSIPSGSVKFWMQRFRNNGITTESGVTRFGDDLILVTDHDGLRFTLVATDQSGVRGSIPRAGIPVESAITGIHGVTLSEYDIRQTTEFLVDSLNFRLIGEENGRYRFRAGGDDVDSYVECIRVPGAPRGSMGPGSIHHVAFRVQDDEHQVTIRDRFLADRIRVTPVIDRTYFHSIYFNEPGGAIFEIATDGPGFLVDEPAGKLGTDLKLPPQFEGYRTQIESALEPVMLPGRTDT